MPRKHGRTTERQVSIAVLKVLRTKPNHSATLEELRDEVPQFLDLADGDLAPSETRPGENLWEQLLRNIQSHHDSKNNFIRLGYLRSIGGGYRATTEGLEFLVSLEAIEDSS